jgi:hypothetical protein
VSESGSTMLPRCLATVDRILATLAHSHDAEVITRRTGGMRCEAVPPAGIHEGAFGGARVDSQGHRGCTGAPGGRPGLIRGT